MSIERFLVGAFIVFLVGIGVLYSGVNRAPFRQQNPGGQHPPTHSVLPFYSIDNYRV